MTSPRIKTIADAVNDYLDNGSGLLVRYLLLLFFVTALGFVAVLPAADSAGIVTVNPDAVKTTMWVLNALGLLGLVAFAGAVWRHARSQNATH